GAVLRLPRRVHGDHVGDRPHSNGLRFRGVLHALREQRTLVADHPLRVHSGRLDNIHLRAHHAHTLATDVHGPVVPCAQDDPVNLTTVWHRFGHTPGPVLGPAA